MKRIAVYSALLVALSACVGGDTTPPSDRPGPGPSFVISDATHSAGNPDFFFLSPMVPNPSGSPLFEAGAFNPALSPIVAICQLAVANTAPESAVLPSTSCASGGYAVEYSGAQVALQLADEQYHVNWKIPNSPVTYYRIVVRVGSIPLGTADVKTANSGDANQFVVRKDGSNLPIKFRIERYALCETPGVGPCGTASIPFTTGGRVDLEDTDGNTAGLVNIPAQGGPPADPVTVTVSPCDDPSGLPIDLPKFGECIEVTTDPVGVELSPTAQASVYVCHAVEDPALDELSTNQRKRVTLHRQNGASPVQALPHTDVDECPPETVGAIDPSFKGFLGALVHRDWKKVRKQFYALVAPKPLYARRIDVGAGGKTRGFSNFQLALPATVAISAGDGQVALPGAAVATAPEVLVTDLGGEPVAGATVRFLASAGGLPNPEVAVLTDGDGKASAPWTLAATPGPNTLTAGGRGLASPTDNGPRGSCTDPFQAIQGAPHPAEFGAVFGGCGDGSGAADTPVDLHTGSVTFTATGTYPGDPLPISYGSGGWSYQIDGEPAGTWFSSLVSPFESTGTGGFGEDHNSCGLILSNTSTPWPAGSTTLYIRRNISLSEPESIRISVAIDNDVQIYVDGVDVGPGLLVHDGCPTQESFLRVVSLAAGTHVVAFRAVDRGGSSYFDAAITIQPH